jgi:GNAT superfamily N-acetyltransferase
MNEPEPTVTSLAERPDLADSEAPDLDGVFPEFMHHDEVCRRYWGDLDERFARLQLFLLEDDDRIVGEAKCVPVAWDGTPAGLPGGIDDVLLRAFAADPAPPTAASALIATVAPRLRGRALAGRLLLGMRAAAAAEGFSSLIAPVRPTLKHRYPLAPMDRYVRWRREDGLPFDPWIRLHARLGGELLAVCPESMQIVGGVSEWESWTAMAFPESGDYVVPGALVPVRIDRERDVGTYVEPNVWMRHSAP